MSMIATLPPRDQINQVEEQWCPVQKVIAADSFRSTLGSQEKCYRFDDRDTMKWLAFPLIFLIRNLTTQAISFAIIKNLLGVQQNIPSIVGKGKVTFLWFSRFLDESISLENIRAQNKSPQAILQVNLKIPVSSLLKLSNRAVFGCNMF